jgi:hypothetical protein
VRHRPIVNLIKIPRNTWTSRPEALLVWVTLTVDQNLLPSGGGLKQLVTEKLIFHIFDVRHKSMFRFLAAAGYERETHPGG